jgi:hypothetical protein
MEDKRCGYKGLTGFQNQTFDHLKLKNVLINYNNHKLMNKFLPPAKVFQKLWQEMRVYP